MNKCEDVIPILEKYIDDELTETEKQGVEEHLKHCTACSEELAFANAVRTVLKNTEMPKVPSDFLERVNSAVDNTKKKKTFGIFAARTVSTVAACLVIATVLSLNNKDNLTEHMNFHDISAPRTDTETIIIGTDEAEKPNEEKTEEAPKNNEKKIAENNKKVNKTQKKVQPEEHKEVPIKEIPSSTDTSAEEASAADLHENEPAAYSFDAEKENISENKNIPETAIAATGGGGGSSVRMMGGQKSTKSVYADKECIDEIKAKAEEYGLLEDGIYTMDAENYTFFAKAAESIDPQCELPELSGESISFTIKEKGV